jgi:hypothetical protein
MTAWHLHQWHIDWKHLIDFQTFWVLAFAAVVVGSGFFALFSIAQNTPTALP